MVPHALVSSRRFIDSRVQNHNNELLGHVTDVLLDVATGHIDYVIIACGGLWGMGRKRVLVPWDELGSTYGDQVLIWEKSKAEVASLPGVHARANALGELRSANDVHRGTDTHVR